MKRLFTEVWTWLREPIRMEMHPGTNNSRRPFLLKAKRGKERESCHQDNILQQECSMGEDPLTGAVDIDRAMQLLPKLCLEGWALYSLNSFSSFSSSASASHWWTQQEGRRHGSQVHRGQSLEVEKGAKKGGKWIWGTMEINQHNHSCWFILKQALSQDDHMATSSSNLHPLETSVER